ncbi:PTPA-CTERM sorting domain-containing protein [Egbenema bharatensis]|uniref:PTPA-CTERM sorting domain-containing protein n=1 Tax=Egbenema bharatensis TaxID=3463334 RepID=UPI003A8670D1
MKLKTVGLSIAATAAMGVGTFMGASPANALSFGETLTFFGGTAQLSNVNVGQNATLTFAGTPINFSTSSSFVGRTIDFTDSLLLRRDTLTTWSLVNPESVLLSLSGSPERNFKLTSFNLRKTDDFAADFTGFFDPPGTPGIGQVSSPILGGIAWDTTTGNVFTGNIQVVPTPALLPGLLGMGVAAARKKRKGEASEATPETVEANV